MGSPPSTPKVLIAGAGPAGSFLAQILRGKGIAFELIEREVDLHEAKGRGFALDTYVLVSSPARSLDCIRRVILSIVFRPEHRSDSLALREKEDSQYFVVKCTRIVCK